MTDEQFETLRAIQFAQLAMLQSIEANMRALAQQQRAPGVARVDWRASRQIVDGVIDFRRRKAMGG